MFASTWDVFFGIGKALWIGWSILMTGALVLGLTALAIRYWKRRRALDPRLVALMPAPTLIAEGFVAPFADANPRHFEEGIEILYATDRAPKREDDDHTRFYGSERGNILRMGVAKVSIGDEINNWESLRQITVSGTRDREYLLRVLDVEEMTSLESSRLNPAGFASEEAAVASTREFSELINRQLAHSTQKDIFLYVHGYKVVFENPLLVATEFWHYLGYQGLMLAYAWPATPDLLAYGADLETTRYSARNLRELLSFLATETDAERIHILGYSAGTRLVLAALNELALIHHDEPRGALQNRYRLGQVLLVCSDIDRGIFYQQLHNGLWKLPQRLVIYMSRADSTLAMAERVFRRQRVGRLLENEAFDQPLNEFLRQQEFVELIDVTHAENVAANNGHAYFHKSPWVSSDVLLLLGDQAAPAARGLVRDRDSPLWRFPSDYPQRLAEIFGSRERTPPDNAPAKRRAHEQE